MFTTHNKNGFGPDDENEEIRVFPTERPILKDLFKRKNKKKRKKK